MASAKRVNVARTWAGRRASAPGVAGPQTVEARASSRLCSGVFRDDDGRPVRRLSGCLSLSESSRRDGCEGGAASVRLDPGPAPPVSPADAGALSGGEAEVPVDGRRAVGDDPAGLDQMLQMGQDREGGGADQAWVEADIDAAHQFRNGRGGSLEPAQDRRLAGDAMVEIVAHEGGRVAHGAAMPRQIDFFRPRSQAFQGADVVAHGAVGRRDDGGGPRHHMVAGEQEGVLPEREGEVVGGVARGGERGEGPAAACDRLAVRERMVGREIRVGAGVEGVDLADVQGPRRAVGAAADHHGAGGRLHGGGGG